MKYDDRYTLFLQRASLDVISFQVHRGLPTFNSAALIVLVDRHYLKTLVPFISVVHALAFLTCNIALPKM
jgi:hypothetical protein